MDTPNMVKKGFTLISLVVCVLILSVISCLAISNYMPLKLDEVYLYSDYIESQTTALTELNKQKLVSEYLPLSVEINFNSSGNVNQARSINLSKKDFIIHLGNGYVTFQ